MKDKNQFDQIKKKIILVLKKYNVKKAGIFGSFARGDYSKDSDVDILIQIDDNKVSLLQVIAIENELQDKIGKKVDVVEYEALHPLIKKSVLSEEIKIL